MLSLYHKFGKTRKSKHKQFYEKKTKNKNLKKALMIYPEKTKTLIQKDTCTPMFIAALCTIARTWKQPKCPSTDEWI